MLKQAHLFIKGDVIGVGFRAWAKIIAQNMGVNGWVRNTDNKVETVIQGDENKINRMIEKLKEGMYKNQVEDIEIQWQNPKNIFERFEIKM